MTDEELRLKCWDIAATCSDAYHFPNTTVALSYAQLLCDKLFLYFKNGAFIDFEGLLNSILEKQTE